MIFEGIGGRLLSFIKIFENYLEIIILFSKVRSFDKVLFV